MTRLEVPHYAVQDEIRVDPARTALVVIDMQNDFVRLGGGVLVPNAAATTPAIGRLLDLARASRMRVVYAQDTHRQATRSGRFWPEHCREAAGDGNLSPSWRPVSMRRFFERPVTTRSTAPARRHPAPLGRRHARHLGTGANIGVHYTSSSAALRWYAIVIPRDAISALESFDLEASLRQTTFVFSGQVTTAGGLRTMQNIPVERTSRRRVRLLPWPCSQAAEPSVRGSINYY